MNATDRLTRSESLGQLAKALAAAQAEMKNPLKQTPNPFFKSLYADLAEVRDCVLPVLAKHGLAIVQLPVEMEAGPALETVMLHSSGEWIGSTMLLRNDKPTPQGIGSALTYARRYALQSIAGVAAEADDDGNHASGNTAKHQAKPAPEPAPDANLVAELQKLLEQCRTAVELEAARHILTLKKPELTTDGQKHLAGVLLKMQAKLQPKEPVA